MPGSRGLLVESRRCGGQPLQDADCNAPAFLLRSPVMPLVRSTERCGDGENCQPDVMERGKVRWTVEQMGPPPPGADEVDCPACGAIGVVPYANICLDHAKMRPYCPECGTALMDSVPYDVRAHRAIFG